MVKLSKETLKKVMDVSEWFLAGLVILMSFFIFYYTDFSDTLDNGVLLFESILNGNFFDYYHYAAQNCAPQTVYSANYNIFLYCIFAIWNLPTAILHHMNGFDYMESVKALLWCKLMILFAVAGIIVMIKKILQLYVKDKQAIRLVQLLFALNTCVLVPTMVVVQYDVLSLLAMLIGIYYYLKNRERLFILWFMIALPLKTFAIFVYFPLLLLREKRIPMVFFKTAMIFAIQFICSLPFHGNAWYELCMGTQNRDAMNLILASGIKMAGFSLNLFVVSYLILLVACYILNVENDDVYIPIWCAFFAMSSVIMYMDIRSYWIVLIVPFAAICILFNKKRLRENLLLFIIGSSCYTIYAFMHHWIYNVPGLVTKLSLSRLMKLPEQGYLKYKNIRGLFEYYDFIRFGDVLCTVFFVSVILLLFLNIPYKKIREQWQRSTYRIEHWIIWIQLGISSGMVAVLLYANLAVASPYIYHVKNVENNSEYMDENVCDGDIIEQLFSVEEDGMVEELSFVARNDNISRSSRNAILFTLMDATSENILVQKTLGTALIKNEEVTHLKLDRTPVKKGHFYILKIQGEQNRQDTLIQFQKSQETQENSMLLVNGIKQQGNLVIQLR